MLSICHTASLTCRNAETPLRISITCFLSVYIYCYQLRCVELRTCVCTVGPKNEEFIPTIFSQAPSNLHKAWFAGCFMKSANSEAASIFFDIAWRTRAPIAFLLLKPSLKKPILKPANLGLSARCMHAYSHWGHRFINFPLQNVNP